MGAFALEGADRLYDAVVGSLTSSTGSNTFLGRSARPSRQDELEYQEMLARLDYDSVVKKALPSACLESLGYSEAKWLTTVFHQVNVISKKKKEKMCFFLSEN